jgi:hypothetical protein
VSGTSFHFTSNARQAIFLDTDDRELFLEVLLPASAGLSDELKTSVAGGQECNIARPDPNMTNMQQRRGTPNSILITIGYTSEVAVALSGCDFYAPKSIQERETND